MTGGTDSGLTSNGAARNSPTGSELLPTGSSGAIERGVRCCPQVTRKRSG